MSQVHKDSPDPGVPCFLPSCGKRFLEKGELSRHFKEKHPELLRCHQCSQAFLTTGDIQQHAMDKGHDAFACPEIECESRCSRIDVLKRHIGGHQEDVKRHSCKYCPKYRGENGFKRKDHLMQHLRNYHHIGEDSANKDHRRNSCRHKDCEAYRDGAWYSWGPKPDFKHHSFQKISDYTAHMRKVHNESPFPCSFLGCSKVEGKGYFRKRDLIKHQQKVHGEIA
jgi:hypothetical protein